MNVFARAWLGLPLLGRTWILIWLTVAATVAGTAFARGQLRTPASAPARQEPAEVSTVAPGLTARVTGVEVAAGATWVSIQLDGREELGSNAAIRGLPFLNDSAGERHLARGFTIEGRTLRLRFDGSSSVAPGAAVLNVDGLGVTDSAEPGAPPKDVSLGTAVLTLDVAEDIGIRWAPLAAAAPLGPGSIAVTAITQDVHTAVIEGALEGFTAEQIQSLHLSDARLALEDGSELPLTGGRHGFGPGLRGLELQFELPSADVGPARLLLRLGVNVPAVLQHAEGDLAQQLDDLRKAEGSTAVLSLTRGQ